MLQLNYREFGQGPPVIILHGLFGTMDNWQTIAKKLAEHYTVYIVDQRNHGRSPHTPDFSYPLLADDLHHFMETHWIYKATLIGHSMGGKTVMQFALNYPDMVEKLVVVDIAPKVYPERHLEIFDALLALDLAHLPDRKEAEAHLEARGLDYETRQLLLKNLSRNPAGGFEWKINLPALYHNYRNILDNIHDGSPFEGPALFIRGGQSTHVSDSDIPAILDHFTGAAVQTIPEAGHWVHADAPTQLLDLVLRFLER